MTIWKYDSTVHHVLFIPLYQRNQNHDISVSLTPSANLQNAFLYTSSDFAGMIYGKFSTGVSYLSIGEYSLNPTCFLGNLIISTEYDLDLRILIPTSSGYLGEQVIPISVGFGEDVSPFNYQGEDLFWENDLIDDDFFWYGSTDEVDSYQWRGEY